MKKLKDIRVQPAAMDVHGPSLSKFFEPGGAKGKWLECNVAKDKNIYVLLQKIQYNASVVFLDKCVPIIEKEMHDAGQLTYFDYLYYLRDMLKADAGKEGKLRTDVISNSPLKTRHRAAPTRTNAVAPDVQFLFPLFLLSFVWLHWVLAVAHKTFNCGVWDLVP